MGWYKISQMAAEMHQNTFHNPDWNWTKGYDKNNLILKHYKDHSVKKCPICDNNKPYKPHQPYIKPHKPNPFDYNEKHRDWEARKIEEAHEQGTHHALCLPNRCTAVAESHRGDHALCGEGCFVAQRRHESGDHHSCVTWWCPVALSLKKWMELAKGLSQP